MLSILDDTVDEEDKLKCILFGKSPHALPVVKPGDIIRIHRLKVCCFIIMEYSF